MIRATQAGAAYFAGMFALELLAAEAAVAPRYRNLHKKTDTLVAFHHPSQYSADGLVKPARKTFDTLIVKD